MAAGVEWPQGARRILGHGPRFPAPGPLEFGFERTDAFLGIARAASRGRVLRHGHGHATRRGRVLRHRRGHGLCWRRLRLWHAGAPTPQALADGRVVAQFLACGCVVARQPDDTRPPILRDPQPEPQWLEVDSPIFPGRHRLKSLACKPIADQFDPAFRAVTDRIDDHIEGDLGSMVEIDLDAQIIFPRAPRSDLDHQHRLARSIATLNVSHCCDRDRFTPKNTAMSGPNGRTPGTFQSTRQSASTTAVGFSFRRPLNTSSR